jgi:hypothetical protein
VEHEICSDFVDCHEDWVYATTNNGCAEDCQGYSEVVVVFKKHYCFSSRRARSKASFTGTLRSM